MSRNPCGWFEIYVQDMKRAVKFYGTVLGVELEELETPPHDGELIMTVFPASHENPGAGGALVKMKDVPSGGNSTLVYFNCDDCAVEASRVAGAGGTVQQEKMSIGEHGFIALATDTEGNMFGMHSQA